VDPDKIIIEPILTEKTNALREKNKYVFKVNQKANKIQVMKAVREMFSVKPVSCNIMNVKRKPRNVRSRSGYRIGHTSAWKKAIVTLHPGEKIEIFEST